MEKKKLSELLEEGRFELFKHKRELLIAPIGSGKTYMIMHKAKEFNNVLYLCDTNALEEQVNKDLIKYDTHNVMVMTYSNLYQKTVLDFKDEFIQQFDLIVCDEIHSLVKFSSYGAELKYVIRLLFSDEIQFNGNILMMTATIKYIENLEQRMPQINTYYRIDLMDEEDIFRLNTFDFDTIKHYSQIQSILSMIKDNKEFEYGNKVLIYTSQVSTMLKIQEIVINLGLDSSVIHSLNHDEQMSPKTLARRKRIVEEGKFDGDVLIINASMETGINLQPSNNFKYVIVNSTNIVEITQSRGRVRNDIQCLYTRIDDDRPLSFVDEFIDIELPKDEFMDIFKDMIDEKGNPWGIRKIKNELKRNGYSVKDRKVGRKQIKHYTICHTIRN